jgi:hypothetical protein
VSQNHWPLDEVLNLGPMIIGQVYVGVAHARRDNFDSNLAPSRHGVWYVFDGERLIEVMEDGGFQTSHSPMTSHVAPVIFSEASSYSLLSQLDSLCLLRVRRNVVKVVGITLNREIKTPLSGYPRLP